ncbi:uncharacterized protein LOC126315397 [Schistocerca gregaria]|uniref:uncharacterized protein LOC126315397 n=1 Tax=Schistocerca gregaria TaxID=7010 RepID=UPI00211ED047|nr:uncharacterized protein LOC126315397 [Schistocerca gregaria]
MFGPTIRILSSNFHSFSSMIKQYFNPLAVAEVIKLLFSKPSCFLPHAKVENIAVIDFDKLKHFGFKRVLFDKDNTLASPYQNTAFCTEIKRSVELCSQAFGRENVCICSNTAGSEYDKKKNYVAAKELEHIFKVSVVRHRHNKPNVTFREVANCFMIIDTAKKIDIRPQEIIVIGDRITGDVMFGNKLGMLTILTKPLAIQNENYFIKISRFLEQGILNVIETFGITPPKNPFVSNLPEFRNVIIKKHE